MPVGKVKWFNSAMGYGFIQPGDGDKPIYVSILDVERAGLSDLLAGHVIDYDVERRDGKFVAANLKIVK